MKYQHIKQMQNLADNYIKYKDVASVFTAYGGKWCLSRLSFENIQNLYGYYRRIVKKIETEGEDAFVKEQLHWLGKDDEAEDIIKESMHGRIEKALEYITTRIQGAGTGWMPEELYDKFMNEELLKTSLMTIFKPVYEEYQAVDQNTTGKDMRFTVWNALRQTTTHVTPKHVNFLIERCDFPFRLEEKREEEQGKRVKEYRFVDLKETEDEK